MSVITINPKAEFSTGNTAKMIGIEGLTSSRVKLLCQKDLVPHTKGTGSKQSHYYIKFGDFEKVIEAHRNHRTTSKGVKPYPTIEQFEALITRVATLEAVLEGEMEPDKQDPMV